MTMKNGGVSTIYSSNQILHKAGSRKGRSKLDIAKREYDIKNYKENKKKKKHKKVTTPKKLSKHEKLRKRIVDLETDNKKLKEIIMALVEHTGYKK